MPLGSLCMVEFDVMDVTAIETMTKSTRTGFNH
jgi:hypothetical protein